MLAPGACGPGSSTAKGTGTGWGPARSRAGDRRRASWSRALRRSGRLVGRRYGLRCWRRGRVVSRCGGWASMRPVRWCSSVMRMLPFRRATMVRMLKTSSSGWITGRGRRRTASMRASTKCYATSAGGSRRRCRRPSCYGSWSMLPGAGGACAGPSTCLTGLATEQPATIRVRSARPCASGAISATRGAGMMTTCAVSGSGNSSTRAMPVSARGYGRWGRRSAGG